ncbi:MAG TPA: hypothetical protein VHL11_19400 [Phototrophicaceae bacterium]|jgi:hypothetical protein|nr:hypothetical protein [Phototrophicaceae bacterium]
MTDYTTSSSTDFDENTITPAANLRLGRIMDFTPDDLEANRRGEITEQQREKLREFRQQTLKNHRQSGIVILTLLIIGTVLAFLFGNRELAGMGAMVTPLMAFTFGGSWLMTWMSTRTLVMGQVRSAEGNARLTIGRSRGGKIYGVKIGRKQFFVTSDHYSAFKQDAAYRLYYVDGAPYYLLSAEQL